MGKSLRKDRRNWKKAAGLAILVLLVVSVVGCTSWVDANTPTKDSLEEYEHHLQLFEEEVLLGRTKDEVKRMIGYPDGWEERFSFNPYNSSHRGMDPWDERVHYWKYSSENGAGMRLATELFFSDEGLVEEVVVTEKVIEGTVDDWVTRRQGVVSQFNYNRD
ncbi:MAG: hypothetical protein FWE41_02955 [Coriobacteriia bacterium]|nr:hypothetical protein [Coriobacteriia bacterium]MCL2750324.1 hypothetical protein [Coriobacteriia bacterium]